MYHDEQKAQELAAAHQAAEDARADARDAFDSILDEPLDAMQLMRAVARFGYSDLARTIATHVTAAREHKRASEAYMEAARKGPPAVERGELYAHGDGVCTEPFPGSCELAEERWQSR